MTRISQFRPARMRPFVAVVAEISALLSADRQLVSTLSSSRETFFDQKAAGERLVQRYAEAIVAAHALLRFFELPTRAIDLLSRDERDPLAWVVRMAMNQREPPAISSEIQRLLQTLPPALPTGSDFSYAIFWVEHLLAATDADLRKAAGVYFTPPPLAEFVIDRVETQLREVLELPSGIADPTVRIIDFSAGAGSFLVAAARRLMRNGVASTDILNRISGIELLPAACVAARILLAAICQKNGGGTQGNHSPRVVLGNALEEQHWRDCRQSQVTVILGNPPFLSSSQVGNRWIENLMRGRVQQPGGDISYHPSKSNTERKTWLQDDYVRFMRLGQFLLEGGGVMGLVTNRGYLENLTFRNMRKSLLHGFANIEVHDFGSRAQAKDKSPMHVKQPLAVSVMSRLGDQHESNQRTTYTSVSMRNDTVTNTSAPVSLEPTPPEYFFRPDRRQRLAEYEQGVALHEVMPIYGSAAVTARDHFVIGFRESEVLARLNDFTNLQISDQAIREKYFTRTRSRRFAPGDTRGFDLSHARQQLAADDSWRQKFARFTYRPFDQRSIIWDDRLIDWPRTNCMNHLQGGDNLALVTRRQAPYADEYAYFWVADSIVIDGVIRNDNRGNESFHPLWVEGNRANFDRQWFARICERIGVTNPDRTDERNIFQFLYAQVSSRIYRTRFAAELCIGFPRVFLPVDRSFFKLLADAGGRLIAAHTIGATPNAVGFTTDMVVAPARGFPQWRAGKVWLNKESSLADVPEEVWEFTVGSHQACRKWLTARRGRVLSANDLGEFRFMVNSIEETIETTKLIDAAIESRGGWRQAFTS